MEIAFVSHNIFRIHASFIDLGINFWCRIFFDFLKRFLAFLGDGLSISFLHEILKKPSLTAEYRGHLSRSQFSKLQNPFIK